MSHCTLVFPPQKCLLMSSFFSLSFLLFIILSVTASHFIVLLLVIPLAGHIAAPLKTSLLLRTPRGRLGIGWATSSVSTRSWYVLPSHRGGCKRWRSTWHLIGTYYQGHTTPIKPSILRFHFYSFHSLWMENNSKRKTLEFYSYCTYPHTGDNYKFCAKYKNQPPNSTQKWIGFTPPHP